MAIVCPHCGQELQATPQLAGHVVSCPRCQGRLTMPAPVAESVPIVSAGRSYIPRRKSYSSVTLFFLFTAGFCLMFLVCCAGIFLANAPERERHAAQNGQPLRFDPNSRLTLSTLNTLVIVEIVRHLPDYEPLDAAFQEPGNSRTVHIAGERYRSTGQVTAEGKASHSYVAEYAFRYGGNPVYSRIEIDGERLR